MFGVAALDNLSIKTVEELSLRLSDVAKILPLGLHVVVLGRGVVTP